MDEESFMLRKYQNGDLESLQEIRRVAFEPIFDSFRSIVGPEIAAVVFGHADKEQADWLEGVCKPESGHDVVIATKGDHIVGFVSWSTDETKNTGEIGLNAVHPDHSGEGIGQQMYEHALSEMRKRGMVVATVGTGGDPSHAPARRAYEKVGFKVQLRSIHMYRML